VFFLARRIPETWVQQTGILEFSSLGQAANRGNRKMSGTIQHEEAIGTWLVPALTNMLGAQSYSTELDWARGPRGGYVTHWGSERAFLDAGVLERRDPLSLLDAFRCSECGCAHHNSEWRYHVSVVGSQWVRARVLCARCGPRTFGDGRDQRIRLRDLAIDIGAPCWELGALGLRNVCEIRDTIVNRKHRAKSSGALYTPGPK
jgi:hypothetical protein